MPTLRTIIVSTDDDGDFILLDTLVGRLSREYGKPRKRLTYATGSGRAEELITWKRKGDRAAIGLRCPDAAGAGACTREHYLLPPEP